MTDLEKFIAKCEEHAVPDSEINLSDMPELTKNDFERGHFKYWKPVKKRNRLQSALTLIIFYGCKVRV